MHVLWRVMRWVLRLMGWLMLLRVRLLMLQALNMHVVHPLAVRRLVGRRMTRTRRGNVLVRRVWGRRMPFHRCRAIRGVAVVLGPGSRWVLLALPRKMGSRIVRRSRWLVSRPWLPVLLFSMIRGAAVLQWCPRVPRVPRVHLLFHCSLLFQCSSIIRQAVAMLSPHLVSRHGSFPMFPFTKFHIPFVALPVLALPVLALPLRHVSWIFVFDLVLDSDRALRVVFLPHVLPVRVHVALPAHFHRSWRHSAREGFRLTVRSRRHRGTSDATLISRLLGSGQRRASLGVRLWRAISRAFGC